MEYAIETIEAREAIGIRAQTTMETIGDDVGRLAGQVLEAAGELAAGPVCARYHTWDGVGGELEILIPISAASKASGAARPSGLPACRAVVAMHEGPYDGLYAAWQAVGAWVKENDHEGGVAPWEEYLNDCGGTPPEDLRTKIVWPLP